MDGVVTVDVFLWVVGFLLGALSANWYFTWRNDRIVSEGAAKDLKDLSEHVSKDNKELHSRVTRSNDRLADFREQVGEKYASVEHLKEVENRLLSELRQLRVDMKDNTAAVREMALAFSTVKE